MTLAHLFWLGYTIEGLAVILVTGVAVYRAGPATDLSLTSGPLRALLLEVAAALAIVLVGVSGGGPKPLYTHLLLLVAVAVLVVHIARSRTVLPPSQRT